MSDSFYRAHILDHYKNPRHFGTLKKATHAAGFANASCGDQLQFQALVKNGFIKEIVFTGSGCAISIAGASLISDHLTGKKVSAIEKLSKRDVEKLLGTSISPAREKCAMLAVETLKKLEKKS